MPMLFLNSSNMNSNKVLHQRQRNNSAAQCVHLLLLLLGAQWIGLIQSFLSNTRSEYKPTTPNNNIINPKKREENYTLQNLFCFQCLPGVPFASGMTKTKPSPLTQSTNTNGQTFSPSSRGSQPIILFYHLLCPISLTLCCGNAVLCPTTRLVYNGEPTNRSQMPYM